MKITARMVLGLAATLAFSSAGWAQDAGIYLGGSFGQATYRGTCPGTQCDDTDSSWRLFAGYRFNRYVSAELGYADLGRTTASGILNSFTISTISVSALDTETTAWDLVVVGTLPLTERLSLTGKAGIYQAEAKTQRTTTVGFNFAIPPIPPSSSVTESSENVSGATFGLGMQYDFMRHFGMRVEWQRYSKIGSSQTGEGDTDVLSASALYRF
jgi:OOP family OmpA-OmpF porin